MTAEWPRRPLPPPQEDQGYAVQPAGSRGAQGPHLLPPAPHDWTDHLASKGRLWVVSCPVF